MLRALNFSLLFFLLNLFTLASAQDFAAVDAHASTFRSEGDLTTVTQQLVAPYETELEKARAIFTYVATTVRYDFKESQRKPADRRARTRPEIVRRAFERKMGVCSGYAFLFDEMCEVVGINAEVVTGTSRKAGRRYNPNRLADDHAWNAVEIDGKWYLLDATWAAGHVNSETGRFTASFDGRLFMQDPERFFMRHFPVETRWQLLEDERSAEAFVNQPGTYRIPQEFTLADFTPKEGVLPNGKVTLVFRVKITGPDKLFLTMGSRRYEMEKGEDGYYEYTLERNEVRGRTVIIRTLKGQRIRPILEYRVEG